MISLAITIWINFVHKKGKQYFILFWNKSCYHIHHWITISIIISILIVTHHLHHNIFYGIIACLLGIMMEDLVYPLRRIFQIKESCSKVCKN